jgi:hypothetical protein
MSVPGHALRCGPETSVTSHLRWRWFELSGYERTYIQPSRPWECGNPEGISKECGKGGKPASWLSMLSILCRFHDLLFARHCWIFHRVFNERIIVNALIENLHGSKNQDPRPLAQTARDKDGVPGLLSFTSWAATPAAQALRGGSKQRAGRSVLRYAR